MMDPWTRDVKGQAGARLQPRAERTRRAEADEGGLGRSTTA